MPSAIVTGLIGMSSAGVIGPSRTAFTGSMHISPPTLLPDTNREEALMNCVPTPRTSWLFQKSTASATTTPPSFEGRLEDDVIERSPRETKGAIDYTYSGVLRWSRDERS